MKTDITYENQGIILHKGNISYRWHKLMLCVKSWLHYTRVTELLNFLK